MPTWTAVPNGDVSLGSWVKETGTGTPIYGEIDEGIAGADGTGIKVTSSSTTVGAAIFTLSDPPADLGVFQATDPSGRWGTAGVIGNHVAYGNGYWVGVGTSGSLKYATDPRSSGFWTSNNQGTSTFNKVAYGNGYWVAVGDSGTLHYKASTPDGSWTSNAQGSTRFRGVTYDNGYWVAVGDSGRLYYKASTPDGSWTSNTQGTRTFYSVTYANGYWVAVGTGGEIRYKASTPDGSWTSNVPSGATSTVFYGVEYGNGYWVAAGQTKTFYVANTPDGTWTLASLPSEEAYFGVAFGGGYWAVGGGNGIYFTADPTGTWGLDSSTWTANSGPYGNLEWNDGFTATQISSGSLYYSGFHQTRISKATLYAIVKTSGQVNDFNMTLIFDVTLSNNASISRKTSIDLFETETYTLLTFNLGDGLRSFTKSELEGLRISIGATKVNQASADTITWYVDAIELVVDYDTNEYPKPVVYSLT